ncbi:hypothetical protein KEM60_00122 [Austwickia sp. TVS 96-490-7B]|nr:hypothetical protein [Austwickia sp. TVS 96-490-7B]
MGQQPYEAMNAHDLKKMVKSVQPDSMNACARDYAISQDLIVDTFLTFQKAMKTLSGQGWTGAASAAALNASLKTSQWGSDSATSSRSMNSSILEMERSLTALRDEILAMPYDDPAGKLLVGSASTYPGMGSLRDAYKEAQDKADRQRPNRRSQHELRQRRQHPKPLHRHTDPPIPGRFRDPHQRKIVVLVGGSGSTGLQGICRGSFGHRSSRHGVLSAQTGRGSWMSKVGFHLTSTVRSTGSATETRSRQGSGSWSAIRVVDLR